MTYMMNTIIKQADLFPFDRIYGKYHLVTYNGDCGDDDKDYVNDLTEAKRLAKSYLKGDDITLPYEKVMVFNEIDNILSIYKEKNIFPHYQILSDLGKASLYGTTDFKASAQKFENLAYIYRSKQQNELAYCAYFYSARLYDRAEAKGIWGWADLRPKGTNGKKTRTEYICDLIEVKQ